MYKCISIIISLIYIINLINAETTPPSTLPTITSVDAVYTYINFQHYPVLLINGTNLLAPNQVPYPIWFGKYPMMPPSSTSSSIFSFNLATYNLQTTYLVDSTVALCAPGQTCASDQTFEFKAPPYCNQSNWMIDSGSPITIVGVAFPNQTSTITNQSQIVFKKNNIEYTSNITLVNSTLAIITPNINLVSGVDYVVSNITMNGRQAIHGDLLLSFNPPNITSLDCHSNNNQNVCVITGTSFGLSNNTLNITVYMDDESEQQTMIIPNGIGSLVIPDPSELLLKNGTKTMIMDYDGNQSNYTITTSFYLSPKIPPPKNDTVTQPPTQVISGSSGGGLPTWKIIVVVVFSVVGLLVLVFGGATILTRYRKHREKTKKLESLPNTNVPLTIPGQKKSKR